MENFGLIREAAGRADLRPIPVPRLRDDYLLVKTVAVALNPTDWTTLDAVGADGTLVGCDYAGIVEQVGKAVQKSFKKGDRVAGFAHGANDAEPENGAFAKFIAVKGDLQMHIPDNVSFEAAATVGVGIGTTGYGLYKVLQLPFPGIDQGVDNSPILIYGGSTATATLAIQFAKLSGRKVITTCSAKHFSRMKELGADAVYDYVGLFCPPGSGVVKSCLSDHLRLIQRTPKVDEQIRADTEGRLKLVFDTVAVDSSAAICAEAIGPDGGVYCNLLGVDCPRGDVKSIFFLGYSLSGESYIFEGETYAAQPEDLAFGMKFCGIAEKLWAEGKWKAHPQRLEGGGLLGTIAGMQQMREGKVSGEKLVYVVDETPSS